MKCELCPYAHRVHGAIVNCLVGEHCETASWYFITLLGKGAITKKQYEVFTGKKSPNDNLMRLYMTGEEQDFIMK